MSSLGREAAAQASDKESATSLALMVVIICLGNIVLAFVSEPIARALELIGQH
jgi:hypothetical protein